MSSIIASNLSFTLPIDKNDSNSLGGQLLKSRSLIGGKVSNHNGSTSIEILTNLNFSIRSGDRVGLWGHNGAGKSTLLRILARIYSPTAGTLQTTGTTRAILSMADGLEPSLSGRKNLFRIGLLRGIPMSYLKSAESEIIEFSGLEEFIDFPVRTYSSGMQVRLIFSVITSLPPEILILDEFFGTGDENFIEKSKRRILKLSDEANILIIATHSRKIMSELTNRVMTINKGQLTELTKQEIERDFPKITQ